ncbi:MAG: polyketide antibiotic transporter [Propionibacteriaceae bacterium]|jgi:ABC-2 type transport system permease protein|nr:polyketide antibiotic transporter [Propionibacteriaceae bacterium]
MNALAGTWALFRAGLKRDKARLATWAVAIPLTHWGVAVALRSVFSDDPASMAARGAIMETPTGVIFGGPGYGSDHYTVAAMISNEMTLYYELPLAIGLLLLVTRATRGDEESGRFELIGAASVGRLAALTSGLVTALLLAVLNGALLSAVGVAVGLDAASSLAWAWGIAGCGFLFAALGALVAQLTSLERSANMAALVAVGIAFMLRAIGDMQQQHGSWLSWLSPLAWTQQLRAYVELRLWPLSLYLVVSAVLVTVAFALAARRDLGAGLLPDRLGRVTAPRSLASPMALALRLLRTNVLVWLITTLALGAACGPLMAQLGEYVRENAEVYEKIFGLPTDAADQLLAHSFMAYLLLFFTVFGAVVGVTATGRLRAAEIQGTMEAQLARPVSRYRLLGAWCTVGLAVPVLLLTLGAFTMGVLTPEGYWGDSSSALTFGLHLAGQSLVYLPAAAIVTGVAVALFGWAPKLIGVAWGSLGYVVLCGMFGQLLALPDWAIKVSGVGATPLLPSQPMQWPPVLIMSVIAAALIVLGFIGFRRRDVPAN